MKRQQTACMRYVTIFISYGSFQSLSILCLFRRPSSGCPGELGSTSSRRKAGQLQTSSPSAGQPDGLGNTGVHRNVPSTSSITQPTAPLSLRSFLCQGRFIFTYIYAQSLFRASHSVLAKKFPEYIFVRLNTSASALTQ